MAIKLRIDPTDHQIAQLSAWAIGLSLLDSIIPSPILGVKTGFANIVILLVLHQFGIKTAIWVQFLRIFASSLLFGFFLTPTFFLSLSGGICSLFITIIFFKILFNNQYFSLISLSIIGSFAHIIGQIYTAYLWIIPNMNIIYLIPIFATSALIFGLINGLVAEYLLSLLKNHHKKTQDII